MDTGSREIQRLAAMELSGLTATSVARKGATAAAGLLLLLPNFIIFAVLQKSMIETMVTSGIK